MLVEVKYSRRYKLMLLSGGCGCLMAAAILWLMPRSEARFPEHYDLTASVNVMWDALALMILAIGLIAILSFFISLYRSAVALDKGVLYVRGPFGIMVKKIKENGVSVVVNKKGILQVRTQNGHVRARILEGHIGRQSFDKIIDKFKADGVAVRYE